MRVASLSPKFKLMMASLKAGEAIHIRLEAEFAWDFRPIVI